MCGIRQNVGQGERLASLVGGGLLAVLGLQRGNLDGYLMAALGGGLLYRGLTGHCEMYTSLGVNTADESPQAAIHSGEGVKIEESVTINKPCEELYRFWRKVENLPRVMPGLIEVKDLGGGRSHWVAKGPMGTHVEWDAETITQRENELIGWKSVEGASVDNSGSVHFVQAPGQRATEVRVSFRYNPPLGKVGAGVAWLLGDDPEEQVRESLGAFKRMMEHGGQPTMQGQPVGERR